MTTAVPRSSLTPAQRAARTKGLGGTDAKRIMDGEQHSLWLEKTGQAQPEDLSRVLPVQIGIATEALNLSWFEQETGKQLLRCDDTLTHPSYDWMLGNFDAFLLDPNPVAVVDAKHVGNWVKLDTLAERYYPQMQHYMAVVNLPLAILSVFSDNNKWTPIEIAADPAYQARLIEAEAAFWHQVVNKIEPEYVGTTIAASVPVVMSAKPIDLSTCDNANLVASMAGDWLDNIGAAKLAKDAEAGIKSAVPAEAVVAFMSAADIDNWLKAEKPQGFISNQPPRTNGIAIERNKGGALSIKPLDAKLRLKLKL